ncbi:hypothetical protein OQA88_3411 [Cercophora sp. LCS_1]
MAPQGLPIDDLPLWARLNNVTFTDIKVTNSEGKGFGVISQKDITTTEDSPKPTILTVPHNLILNQAAVDEYAKEDRNFRQLHDTIGRKSPRADILLFLLVQSSTNPSHAGISNPWVSYLKFLPTTFPLPTLWTEPERLLLRGTSLEAAVTAKILALDAEFNHIQDLSSALPTWNDALWLPPHPITHLDYLRLDALYRSRCLELPRSGESLVPCIDMLNHSSSATAYYDETSSSVDLHLRPGSVIKAGNEITISYGDAKSAAEMLFSYGFIDSHSAGHSLVLPLEALDDDPLAKAKLVAFEEAPKVRVARNEEGVYEWEAPFVYFMCVNEEDGLEFRVLQDREGGRQLRVFWFGEDVTDRVGQWEEVIRGCEMEGIFRLRAVTVVQERLREQLGLTREYEGVEEGDVRSECREVVRVLRQVEMSVLEGGIEALEKQVCLFFSCVRIFLDDRHVPTVGIRCCADGVAVSPCLP